MKHPTHPVEQEEVMAYLDGELSAERAAELAAHIEHCTDCQALAHDLRGVSSQMLAWQIEPAPDSIATSTLQAAKPHNKTTLRAKRGSHFRLPQLRWRRWVVALASLTIVVLVGQWLLSTRMAQRSSETEGLIGFSGQGATSPGPRPGPAPEKNGIVADSTRSQGDSAALRVPHYYKIEGASAAQGPMVARTASLAITVKDFSTARASIERIVAQLHGYLGELTTESPKEAAQTLTATLRIPAPQLDAALTQLKALGRVEQESQKGEEVSEQHADLVARLKNARTTEQRLLDVLRQRTGKVSDVLEVEEQISSVRQDIERMEAEQKNLETRVAYGTVQLRVTEEYKATLTLAPPSTLTSLRNAATDGYQTLIGSLLGLVLWLMSNGPVLVFWALLLFWPAKLLWRRLRGAIQQPTST